MICFKVLINGENICTAGIKEAGVLSAIITMVKDRPQDSRDVATHKELDFSVGGLKRVEEDSDLYVDWVKRKLSVGDEVTITIVDVATSDDPISVSRKDSAI